MTWPYTFASLSGIVPASYLDANFNAAAELSALTALQATVSGLPSSSTPLIAVAGGAAGFASTLSRSDHQHPPQAATQNFQIGTTYTVQASDNGKVVDLANAGAIAVTVPATLPVGFNCLFCQGGAGQVTFAPASGASQRQRAGYDKTIGQWSIVSLYVRENSGGSAAEYVLAGDMTT